MEFSSVSDMASENSKSVWKFESFSLWGFVKRVPRLWIFICPDNLGRVDCEAPSADEWLGLLPQSTISLICRYQHPFIPCQASDISKRAITLEPETVLIGAEDPVVIRIWDIFPRAASKKRSFKKITLLVSLPLARKNRCFFYTAAGSRLSFSHFFGGSLIE